MGKYLLGCIESYNKGEDLDLGIYYKNEWVGRAGLHRFQKSKKIAEISYWLDQSFEGRGIMSRSICTLCKYGFTTLDIK